MRTKSVAMYMCWYGEEFVGAVLCEPCASGARDLSSDLPRGAPDRVEREEGLVPNEPCEACEARRVREMTAHWKSVMREVREAANSYRHEAGSVVFEFEEPRRAMDWYFIVTGEGLDAYAVPGRLTVYEPDELS